MSLSTAPRHMMGRKNIPHTMFPLQGLIHNQQILTLQGLENNGRSQNSGLEYSQTETFICWEVDAYTSSHDLESCVVVMLSIIEIPHTQ